MSAEITTTVAVLAVGLFFILGLIGNELSSIAKQLKRIADVLEKRDV